MDREDRHGTCINKYRIIIRLNKSNDDEKMTGHEALPQQAPSAQSSDTMWWRCSGQAADPPLWRHLSHVQLIHLSLLCSPHLPQSNLEMCDVSLTWPWRFPSLFLPLCRFSSLSRADMGRKLNFTETKCSYITLSCYRAFCCIGAEKKWQKNKAFLSLFTLL